MLPAARGRTRASEHAPRTSRNGVSAAAAGLGINAVVAFGLVKGAGLSWQGAMGVVALEGLAICIAMALGVRKALLDAVPVPIKLGIGAGIGAFIFAIGFFNGGLAVG